MFLARAAVGLVVVVLVKKDPSAVLRRVVPTALLTE